MDARLRRVNKEIAGGFIFTRYSHQEVNNDARRGPSGGLDCKNDKTSQIKVDLIDNSPFHLKGSFSGPEGTPYEGGHFEVVSSNPHH